MSIFDWLETWYNRKRRHSHLTRIIHDLINEGLKNEFINLDVTISFIQD